MTLFLYPEQTFYNKIVPKQTIYDKVKVASTTKDLFSKQVNRIRWAYKLSGKTIHIEKTNKVPEIVILQISLNTPDISTEVLSSIDKAIPLPVIFELAHENKTKVMAIYKRPNDADNKKWTTQGGYLSTAWLDKDTHRDPLPTTANLEQLYEKLLSALLPIHLDTGQDISTSVETLERLEKLKKEHAKLKDKLQKSKQFKRQVEIQQQIHTVLSNIKKIQP